MKISNNIVVNYKSSYKHNREKEVIFLPQNNSKITSLSNIYYVDTLSFGKRKKKKLHPHYNARLAELKEKKIETAFASRIANLPDEQYKRANELYDKAVRVDCIEELAQLEPLNYAQAMQLVEKGIYDSHLHQIASLDKEKFERALDFMKKGIDSDCINLYVNLTPTELKEAETLLKEGYPPIIAGNFCKLNKEQREIAQIFINKNSDVELACDISTFDKDKRQKCIDALNDGIDPEFVCEVAELKEEQRQRLPKLRELRVSDTNIGEFAGLNHKDYKKALEMLTKGIYEDYITYIIDIENGKTKNKEYKNYRAEGCSKTSAYSLSLLTEEELEALKKLEEKNPILKDILKDEYEIVIIEAQNDDSYEAICTKQIRTPEGTKITLVRTFDEYSFETKTRTEEYADNSTSSIMSGRSGTFRTKYDKNGEIKELTEFVQDEKTGGVTGVFHSKLSNILAGAYECTYYDISEFKVGGDPNADIKSSVIGDGETVSKVTRNEDGSITYTEFIELNDSLIDRKYTEKRDNNGRIMFSEYSYVIKKEDEEIPIMDISRTFRRNSNNSTTNIINGIAYETNFDDENKKITITDGKKTKVIEVKEKLPFYSSEILWNEIKNLHVDTIMTIFDNVDKWNYCVDEDSISSPPLKSISTGTNNSIIYHEAGHIIANLHPEIFEDEDFSQKYGSEMQAFQSSIPYNEQEYIQYFSPRADLMDSDGSDELIAEANMLFTTYGTTNSRIKTRTQFLAKYFPETIAKVAELTGRNSKESLLK